MKPLRLALLGSTGSIGKSTLRAVRALGSDRVQVRLLSAGGNTPELLAQQANDFNVKEVYISDHSKLDVLKTYLPDGTKAYAGGEALCQALHGEDIDLVLCGISGSPGLLPVIETLKAGKRLALATKEALVMAGSIVTKLAREKNIMIFPVDSEHNAIFQCLEGRDPASVRNLILTASGGPFRSYSYEQLRSVTWEAALKHPTWSMGPKISVDSASLMNKALEVIEAKWLFDVPADRIEVQIHPQSIIHSMIRFVDGSVMAQMSSPDMRFPIQYALTWPERLKTDLPELDFSTVGQLTFQTPDPSRFPAIELAKAALQAGKTMPAVLNAANEIAVARFAKGEIGFVDIWELVRQVMTEHTCLDDTDLSAVLEADRWARARALELKF